MNHILNSKCLDLGDEDDIGAGMWTYQSCTEMVVQLLGTIVQGVFYRSALKDDLMSDYM